jgi:hypothetical protein
LKTVNERGLPSSVTAKSVFRRFSTGLPSELWTVTVISTTRVSVALPGADRYRSLAHPEAFRNFDRVLRTLVGAAIMIGGRAAHHEFTSRYPDILLMVLAIGFCLASLLRAHGGGK